MTERITVSSGTEWEQQVGYSRAVRIGDHVWVSGTTGSGTSAAEQTRAALQRIIAALADVGAEPSHVVRTRIFVTDIAKWPEIGAEHARVFGTAAPAATMVEVAALIDPALVVEIEVDAYLG
ncbi:MAG: RidA family protein [Gordonia sp. (in: high G+C Gram-positive bacteria)]